MQPEFAQQGFAIANELAFAAIPGPLQVNVDQANGGAADATALMPD